MNKVAPDNVHQGVLTRELKHWSEFTDLIRKEHANSPAFIYRGQAHNWLLYSTLDRFEIRYPKKRNFAPGPPKYFDRPPATRDHHLNAFKEAARGRTDSMPVDSSEDEWWALASHHGLATPLLDWTYYPFVALFFAFEEERVWINESFIEPKKRFVYRVSWHLLEEKTGADTQIPFPYVPRLATSNRFINQRAISIKMPEGIELEKYIRSCFSDEKSSGHDRAVLEKIEVASDDRSECLKFLNKMGINRLSLFPDLDGAAAYINNLWEIDFDSSIGQITSRRDRSD